MNTVIKMVVAMMLMLGAHSHVHAYFGEGKPLLCALQSVSECFADGDCESVTPELVNLPDFFLVDHAQKVLRAAPGTGSTQTTPIERGEQLDGRLILQGGDDGVEDYRDGVAWTLSIDNVTGKLVMSAAGDGFALVGFGSCLVR